MDKSALVIHAGAFIPTSMSISDGGVKDRVAALHEALREGFAVLSGGGSALDAAIRAVIIMENNPLFNAGKGAVLTTEGIAELDACVMNGTSGRCGGVSTVKTIRNPVLAARAVMEHSPHSILCAMGAEQFAREQGLEMVANDYFVTRERQEQLEEALKRKRFDAAKGLSTVGAAARDPAGRLAAATSTGGLTGKLPGRVSDSSIAGAGTWAADGVCALSCTGTGDVFIRNATAREVACRVEYGGGKLAEAARESLARVKSAGGTGGIVALAPDGPAVMEYNTSAMSRGFVLASGEPFAAVL
ncbi:MAG TPA: isoaspartyl peptidase/L-asparaginase [Patescibacteria group bacterium]|nr:isoaspartyl peptidase/L-asparaginase [Patescibacteria group bacterium]